MVFQVSTETKVFQANKVHQVLAHKVHQVLEAQPVQMDLQVLVEFLVYQVTQVLTELTVSKVKKVKLVKPVQPVQQALQVTQENAATVPTDLKVQTETTAHPVITVLQV